MRHLWIDHLIRRYEWAIVVAGLACAVIGFIFGLVLAFGLVIR